MKLLMLLSNEYRPDPRVRKEAITLIDEGHEVTILCWNRMLSALDHQDDAGISIDRVRTGKVSGMLRLATNLPLFFLRAYLRSRSLKFDAVHCHDYDTLLLGILISRLRRVPLVYDSHEWYSKMVQRDLPGFMGRVIERTESLMVANCATVIAANDAVADHLRKSGAARVIVVMNCVDLPVDPPCEAYREKSDINLFYGGTLEPGRFVKEMLEVVKGDTACILRIAGNGRMVNDVKEAAAGCSRIEFLGYITQDQVLENISRSDAVVCMLDPSNGNYAIATPNKLFEAMAYGVPAVVTEGTYSADMVRRLDCGLVVEYSINGLLTAVASLKDVDNRIRMGRKGRASAEREYNWAENGERLCMIYRSFPWRESNQ